MRAAGIALSLGMDVKVADIQGGKDPADLVLANPEDWKNVLRGAKPIVEFELANIIKETPDPRKLPKAIRDRIFPFLVVIESETDRAYFVRLIADKANLPEQAIRDDIRAFVAKQKESAPVSPTTSNTSQNKSAQIDTKRIDLVERRLFGLLDLMKKAAYPKESEYRESAKKIAGSSYEDRWARIEMILSDISFEAENFFGGDQKKWDIYMKDLLINFEEDLINEELVVAMNELRIAEKKGDQAVVAELAKKCQALSIRKASMVKGKG